MGLPCFWDARSGFVCARCGLVVQSCAKLGAVRQVRRCGRAANLVGLDFVTLYVPVDEEVMLIQVVIVVG